MAVGSDGEVWTQGCRRRDIVWVHLFPAENTVPLKKAKAAAPRGREVLLSPLLLRIVRGSCVQHQLGQALPSLLVGPKPCCLCLPRGVPDGSGKILAVVTQCPNTPAGLRESTRNATRSVFVSTRHFHSQNQEKFF